jgi:hypothetical protein
MSICVTAFTIWFNVVTNVEGAHAVPDSRATLADGADIMLDMNRNCEIAMNLNGPGSLKAARR